jgi:hypothetical protein
MLRVPGDSAGAPVYARAERPFVFHTAEWAAFVFYRSPGCVPDSVNLLDFPSPIPAVFSCPLKVSGFELWDKGPGLELGPRHALSTGSDVPVWFVPWAALQHAIQDGILTIVELEALTPLKGIATNFHEVLHPSVPPGAQGGAKVPHLTITALGYFPVDGRTFHYRFTDVGAAGEPRHVQIVFR